MNKNISSMSILKSAWIDFKKSQLSLLLFTSISFVLSVISIQALFLSAESSLQSFSLLYIFIEAILFIYTPIMNKNILDIVYGRKLHWFFISPALMNAALVGFLMRIFSSIYSYCFQLISLSSDGPLIIMISLISLILYACTIYFAVRVMFANQFILENNCTISQAFFDSWKITEGRFWLIMKLITVFTGLIILAIVPIVPVAFYTDLTFLAMDFTNFQSLQQLDAISAMVGFSILLYFLIASYIIIALIALMTAHLFKRLVT